MFPLMLTATVRWSLQRLVVLTQLPALYRLTVESTYYGVIADCAFPVSLNLHFPSTSQRRPFFRSLCVRKQPGCSKQPGCRLPSGVAQTPRNLGNGNE